MRTNTQSALAPRSNHNIILVQSQTTARHTRRSSGKCHRFLTLKLYRVSDYKYKAFAWCLCY